MDEKQKRYATFTKISMYMHRVNDITWLQFFIEQNEISRQLSMETEIFKISFLTVLRVCPF